jgi:hypothetical protein
MTIRSACTGIILLVVGIAGSSALAGSHPNLTVTSNLDGKTVLPLRIPRIAHPQLAVKRVARVDYLIDGQLAWIEHSRPTTTEVTTVTTATGSSPPFSSPASTRSLSRRSRPPTSRPATR